MNYLLHCVPGAIFDKASSAFRSLRTHLAEGGVLFGSTVLNGGVEHTWCSRRRMQSLNEKGIFSNLRDDRSGLERALAAEFSTFSVEICGAVAIFCARR
jgi:hypothetical protein